MNEQEVGVTERLRRLTDEQSKSRLRLEIMAAIEDRGGATRIWISAIGSGENHVFSGKPLQQVADTWNLTPEDAAIRLIRKEKDSVSAVFFSISEDDMRAILQSNHVAVCSDGFALSALIHKAEATHPRSYGTFPRVLGRFVRYESTLSLSKAVYIK
ncbi:MAG: hypothetical protein EHM85_16465 [Desulfobacteraceae bacterium]|nr:MAG: hypothetical protein EHM85_16465 [Desulfobacteraceae bacterium]